MPSKPLSLENGTVEDANFTLEVIDLNNMKFQRVNESLLDNKTKESGGFEGKRVA